MPFSEQIRERLFCYSISISSGASISSETYFPFFFLCFTHSESKYSICPFTERKSSSAHAAISLYSFSESRRGTCFFILSAISIQTSGIHNGLRITVAAKHDKKIRDHSCLSLLVKLYQLLLAQTLKRHLDHAYRTVNYHSASVDNS